MDCPEYQAVILDATHDSDYDQNFAGDFTRSESDGYLQPMATVTIHNEHLPMHNKEVMNADGGDTLYEVIPQTEQFPNVVTDAPANKDSNDVGDALGGDCDAASLQKEHVSNVSEYMELKLRQDQSEEANTSTSDDTYQGLNKDDFEKDSVYMEISEYMDLKQVHDKEEEPISAAGKVVSHIIPLTRATKEDMDDDYKAILSLPTQRETAVANICMKMYKIRKDIFNTDVKLFMIH